MGKSYIPLQPETGVYTLSENIKLALSWYVLSGCSRETVFLNIIRPDLKGGRNKKIISSYISQIFGAAEVQKYIDAYRETLERFLGKAKVGVSKPVETEPSPKKTPEEKREQRIKAVENLTDFVLNLAENISDASDPESVIKYADKLGLLGDTEDLIEAPRRYLPIGCSECAYKHFCEDNTEDLCQKCKYRLYGEDNGIVFDKEEMLKD